MKKMIKILVLALLMISCTKELEYPEKFIVRLSYENQWKAPGSSSGRVAAITFPHVLSNRELVVNVKQGDLPTRIYNGFFNQLDVIEIELMAGENTFIQVLEKNAPEGHIDGLEYRGYSDEFMADPGMNRIPMHWSTQQALILVEKSLASDVPLLSVYESCAATNVGINFGPHLYDLQLRLIHTDVYAIYVNELDRGYSISYPSVRLNGATYRKSGCSIFHPGEYNPLREDIDNTNFDPTPLDSLIIEGTTW